MASTKTLDSTHFVCSDNHSDSLDSDCHSYGYKIIVYRSDNFSKYTGSVDIHLL